MAGRFWKCSNEWRVLRTLKPTHYQDFTWVARSRGP
jgi:hypothetical protein